MVFAHFFGFRDCRCIQESLHTVQTVKGPLMYWEELARTLRFLNWAILLVLGSLSFFFMSPTFTLGILAGGLVIIANFNLLQRTVRRGFSAEGILHVKKVSIIAKYYLRLTALGVIIYILIAQQCVHPVGLAVGLSIVVIGIVLFGIQKALRTSSRGVV